MAFQCQFTRRAKTITNVGLRMDDIEVSRLSLWRLPMRVGGSEVLMGGIGGMGTHRDHRKRGYASTVMQDSVDWMGEQGFDVSVLFGIHDFYWRWGFITTLSSSTLGVPTRHAETVRRTCRVRRYRPGDLAAAMRIYNRDNRRRTASIVRRKSTWIPWRMGVSWGVKPDVFVYSRRGRMLAVAAYSLQRDAVQCCELSAADPSAFGGMLHHAAALAVERRVEKIVFHLPPDHPFVDFCREQGCELRERTPRDAGGMARIINQTQCLGKITPELTRRLGESTLRSWSGSLDIVTDLDATRLKVRRGRVSVGRRRGRADVRLELPQERLTQLLFGFQPVSFLRSHGKARLTGDRAGVVDALFPKGHPYVWLPDHF